MQHKTPDPNASHPIPGIDTVIYVKPARDSPNIVVGDFTCFADKNFGERVAHHYDFY